MSRKQSSTFENVEERLKANTIIDETTGCWLWQGGLSSNKHGYIWVNFRGYSVHRISAYLYLGYDLSDETTQINHKRECPNPHCWNPEHLYIGTHWENVQDMIATGKASNQHKYKSFCIREHEFTPENTYIIPTTGARVCRICKRENRRKP